MNLKQNRLSDIKIEVCSEKDILTIIDIEEKTWISSYPNKGARITEEDIKARFGANFRSTRYQEIKTEMASDIHSYRTIRQKGIPIAYSHLLKEPGYGDLVEVYVLPLHQGKGIGGALINDGLKWLDKDKPVRLEVARYNPAVAIYEHYGFVERPELKQTEDERWNVLPSGKRIPIKFMEKPAK